MIVVLCCVGAYPVHSILLLQPSHSHIRLGGGDPVSCVLIGPSTRPFFWSTRLVDRRNLGKREDSSRRFLRSKGNSGSDRREDIPVCEGLGCSPSVPLAPHTRRFGSPSVDGETAPCIAEDEGELVAFPVKKRSSSTRHDDLTPHHAGIRSPSPAEEPLLRIPIGSLPPRPFPLRLPSRLHASSFPCPRAQRVEQGKREREEVCPPLPPFVSLSDPVLDRTCSCGWEREGERQRQRDVWNTHGQQRHHGQDHDTWMQPCLLRSGNPPARLLHLPRHRQEGLLPRASGRRSTPRLAGQRRGPRVAGGEVGRRRGTPFDPRSATRKRRTQVLWETPIAVPSERSMRPLRGHRCVVGVAGRDLTSSPGNRVGNVTVVPDHPNCFARAKGMRSMEPSEAGDPWERVGSRSEISKGGNDQQAVCRADLVDLPIRFSLDAESPQWRKGPAHKPQLVR